MYSDDRTTPGQVGRFAAVALVGLAALLALIMGATWGFKAFGRSQDMAEAKNKATIARIHANNQVTVTAIQIRNQRQRVQVAKQQAQIRFENSKGVREAQDEIAKTLTPLYVQFEYAEALKEIAKSGRNSSVVYIPSGAGGVPLVSGVAGQPAVTAPSK